VSNLICFFVYFLFVSFVSFTLVGTAVHGRSCHSTCVCLDACMQLLVCCLISYVWHLRCCLVSLDKICIWKGPATEPSASNFQSFHGNEGKKQYTIWYLRYNRTSHLRRISTHKELDQRTHIQHILVIEHY
jgi:hypothetical protein